MAERRLIDANALISYLYDDSKHSFLKAPFMNCTADRVDVKFLLLDAPTVNATQWISVKDKLPEKSCQVLCYCAGGSIFNAEYDESIDDDFPIGFWEQYYDHETYGWQGEEWNPINDVTHWMPLPEPPKEDDNG